MVLQLLRHAPKRRRPMILALHSDASYLSEPNTKSRAAGHFYLGKLNDNFFDNGTILTLSKIIKHGVRKTVNGKRADQTIIGHQWQTDTGMHLEMLTMVWNQSVIGVR